MSQKIGILGGTFNPIHSGHLMLGIFAKEEFDLDRILVMPAGNPYLKEGQKILPGETRLSLVKRAVEDLEGFEASDHELKKEGKTYTWETMRELKEKNGDATLYFIVGADCLQSFSSWVYPDRILAKCELIAACRGNVTVEKARPWAEELEKKYGGIVHLMDFPAIEISSTQIRDRIRDGKSIRFMVPEKIEKEIVSLYKENGVGGI